MKSEQVLSELANKGINISLMTLTRYHKSGLLPEPTFINLGREGGRSKDWPDVTPAQAYAANRLINGLDEEDGFRLSPKGVKEAREKALTAVEKKDTINLGIRSIVWLRLIREYYGGNAVSDEINFLEQFETEGRAAVQKWLDRLENMTPEEKNELNARALEELELRRKQ